jgi:hypothetical protein
MLRAILLASPLALALVSCGDSAPSFDDSTLPTNTGATGATAGDGSGATSSQGGSSASAGDTNGAGTENGSAGTSSTSGGAGNSGGKGNTAGDTNAGGTSMTGGGKGGTGNNAGSGNGGTGNNAGSGNGGAGMAGSGGTGEGGNTQAGTSSGAGMGGTSSAGMGGTAGVTCPNVFGNYDIVDTAGSCAGLNKDAPQSIQGTDVACYAHFVSVSAIGGTAVNGGAALDENGNFSGASLYFGKSQRSPCSGTWNQVDERMTVKCAVQNETCTVVMDRK